MGHETGTAIAISCAVGAVAYYAWNWAFSTAQETLLPPMDLLDSVTGLHHVRDHSYLLSDTPRIPGNLMGFTEDQVKTIITTSLDLRGGTPSPNDLPLLMNLVGSHESKGISFVTDQVTQDLTSRKIHDALIFYRGDCAFTDVITNFNKEVALSAHTETVCTCVALSAAAFIFFNPSSFLNIMGFGADSFISKLSWSNFGSLAQITTPLSLGAISTILLTGTSVYGSASALSQGLVRPMQVADAFNHGLSKYRYRVGCVTPGSSGVMEGPRENYNPDDFCIGERSAQTKKIKMYLKSKSFAAPASLAIGSLAGLKCISTLLNGSI